MLMFFSWLTDDPLKDNSDNSPSKFCRSNLLVLWKEENPRNLGIVRDAQTKVSFVKMDNIPNFLQEKRQKPQCRGYKFWLWYPLPFGWVPNDNIRGVARGGFQGFRNPPPSRVKEPPILFLTVILSQQECNGLSIPEILRFVLCLQ